MKRFETKFASKYLGVSNCDGFFNPGKTNLHNHNLLFS